MNKFWESSPEWQRKIEAFAACETAEKAMHDAGERILSCILSYGPDMSNRERDARAAYLESRDEFREACSVYSRAEASFEASPVGKAKRTYLADPIAREVA